MRRYLLFTLLVLGLAVTATARAELRIGVGLSDHRFLLFEPIPVKVVVENNSEMQALLHGQPRKPWLRFLITTRDGEPVRRDRGRDFSEVLLQPGQRKGMIVNITPLYQVREPGDYILQAVLSVPGHPDMLSQRVHFEVRNGEVLWSDTRPQGGDMLTYELIRFNPTSTTTKLYLRVTDRRANRVYGTTMLGNTTHILPPQANWDKADNLHLLYTVGLGHYRYCLFDARGRLRGRYNYESRPEFPPRLFKHTNGMVEVAGGRLITRDARPTLSSTTFGEERLLDERAAPGGAPATPSIPDGPSDEDLPAAQRASQSEIEEQLRDEFEAMSQRQLDRPRTATDLILGPAPSEDEALPE